MNKTGPLTGQPQGSTPPIVQEYKLRALRSARARWRGFGMLTWGASIGLGLYFFFTPAGTPRQLIGQEHVLSGVSQPPAARLSCTAAAGDHGLLPNMPLPTFAWPVPRVCARPAAAPASPSGVGHDADPQHRRRRDSQGQRGQDCRGQAHSSGTVGRACLRQGTACGLVCARVPVYVCVFPTYCAHATLAALFGMPCLRIQVQAELPKMLIRSQQKEANRPAYWPSSAASVCSSGRKCSAVPLSPSRAVATAAVSAASASPRMRLCFTADMARAKGAGPR